MNSALHTSKFKEAFHEKTFEIDTHLVSMTNICDLYLQKSLLKKSCKQVLSENHNQSLYPFSACFDKKSHATLIFHIGGMTRISVLRRTFLSAFQLLSFLT